MPLTVPDIRVIVFDQPVNPPLFFILLDFWNHGRQQTFILIYNQRFLRMVDFEVNKISKIGKDIKQQYL